MIGRHNAGLSGSLRDCCMDTGHVLCVEHAGDEWPRRFVGAVASNV